MNEFQGQTAAVIGLARAGIPAAKFLAERGAKVVGFDGKTREQISPAALELESLGARLVLGDHDFAGIEKCDLIVLSPGLKIHFEPLKSVIEKAEARGAEVIGELELASRFCPCPIIGVTGTKGKSTTTKLITEMLQACGIDAIAAGNTGTPLIEILPMLKAESWAVVEVSSFQLERAPTFRPKIAVLLNLLEDHQDYHPTLEQYWETKLKIFDNQGEGDYAIFNVDDPKVVKECVKNFGVPTTCHRLEDSPSISWWKGVDDNEGEFIPWVWGDEKRENLHLFAYLKNLSISLKKFPLKGMHNASNLAAALGTISLVVPLGPEGLSYSVDRKEKLAAIQDTVDSFQSLPHRLEVVARKNGINFVNDSQSTIPDAAIAALKSFPSPVTLLVGGRAKIQAEGYADLMRAVKTYNVRLVLFGEAKEMLYQVALSIGVEKSQINRENILAEALQTAKMNALNGETVILSPACASFDQFNSYEHRGEVFRALVEEF